MIAGVPKETCPGERRVALIPASLQILAKAGVEVIVESGAGIAAGYPDGEYEQKGAALVADRNELFAKADVILQVRGLGANPEAGKADLERMKRGQVVIGFLDPLTALDEAKVLAERGVAALSMEMMPRITRAQSMDALSSMATVAGYKAVLLAAVKLPRMFPMFMTAAGTIVASHVLVVGVGVAGLQALATAKRLGAVTSGYDVRPAVREQVESVGAKFVDLGLDTADAEDKGGYAKEQSEEFLARQREALGKVVAANDVIITTAAIPGRKAPVIITADMVKGMKPGSVIVDLAAERGGNCELTKVDEEVVTENGVTILGPANLPTATAYHASQMYAKNITTFLTHLVEDGKMKWDMEDEITTGTLITRDGEIVHPRIRELAGLPAIEKPADEAAESNPAEEDSQ